MKMKQISSTTVRMYEHLDVLKIIKEHKKIKPITIHLALTDKCNLKCPWCSVKNRKMNELSFSEVKGIIDTYVELGVKSLEFTGGGDPTMYRQLADVIHYASDQVRRDGHDYLKVGLITNGLRLNDIEEDALKKLEWLRISLSGIDFDMDKKYYEVDASRLPDFVGVSYVFDRSIGLVLNNLDRVNEVAKHFNAKYIRIVPNCYSIDDIEWTRKIVPPLLKLYQYPNMFLQIKDYQTPKECYWKYVKPFVNSDGFVYQCSGCSLFEGYFAEKWRVAHWTEIKEIYNNPPKSFDTSICSYCFFYHQNNVLSDLMTDVKHKSFF